MLLSALKRGWSAFARTTTPPGRVFLAVILLAVFWVSGAGVYSVLSDFYADYRADHASPTEHLQLARAICPLVANGAVICGESGIETALHHLDKIPASAPEFPDATKLRSLIQTFRVNLAATRQKIEEEHTAMLVKQQADRDRLTHQSEQESQDQMWKNVLGQAHDQFICGTSRDNSPIISFDYGHYWWSDDGRCAAQQQRQREAREKVDEQRRQEEQSKRDSEAESYSYWPTTIRVDTDMDSFWLVNEERTCQTYPDDKGRVAVVSCNTSGSHKDHNIPVKFWGGVDRNTVSDWKCRRESDQFVCRAIN